MMGILKKSGISHRLASHILKMIHVCLHLIWTTTCSCLSGLQVALSPSYCSVVAIKNDGKVKWRQLDYHLGDIGTSMDDRTSQLSVYMC